jgi:diguanylate cyclase (GGDEF)-like protein
MKGEAAIQGREHLMPNRLRKQLDAALNARAKRPFWLRFPDELEAMYEAENRYSLKRELWIIGIGTLLFDASVWADYARDPAHIWRSILIRFALVTPFVACVLLCLGLGIGARFRGRIYVAVVATAGASALGSLPAQDPITCLHKQMGLLVILMVGSLMLWLRFPYIATIAALLLGEDLIYLCLQQSLRLEEKVTCFVIVALGAGVSLLGSYRTERGERASFLLLLCEEMRRKELESINQDLAELSNYDPLTGLSNRRHFNEYFLAAWYRACEHSTPISLVLADIDHFKRLNDTFGHLVGDQVLIDVAARLNANSRHGTDMVARFGGEEFVLLLPDSDEHVAKQIAERARMGVRDATLRPAGCVATVTTSISCGVATMRPGYDDDPIELIARADQALYRAKRSGRDRVSA